jgi:hypothetical protein
VKRYFTDKENYSSEAAALAAEVVPLFTKILQEEHEKGFSIREASHILYSALLEAEAYTLVMKWREEKSK